MLEGPQEMEEEQEACALDSGMRDQEDNGERNSSRPVMGKRGL